MTSGELQRAERPAEDTAGRPNPPPGTVTGLATTPVKGLRIVSRREVMLTRLGVPDNRRFYLVDEQSRMVNGKTIGILSAVQADFDAGSGRLTLIFPDGTEVSGTTRRGSQITTQFFSRAPSATLVEGPWSDALSRYAASPLRLVEADPNQGAVDRGPAGAVSLISEASVHRLEAQADGRSIDVRRFRMLIEVAGLAAHEEDEWVGQTIRIGEARIAMRGHVGRCLVTSQCPDTGVTDMPVLKLLSYRRDLPTTERLAFGIFGEVLVPGLVRLGDIVGPE
jgi:uncharacterized protein YcbX